MEQCMTSIQKSCAVPPEFFVSDERMIRMKLRQKGCSDTQREFLKRFQPSRMVIGIDWGRDEPDQGIAAKLQEWLLKKQRERAYDLLARAAWRGEEEGWGRPVIINPARPELVMLPELPPVPDLGMTSPLREYLPWVCRNHVLLDESLRQWFRRPRSKKKRIREKWRKRAANWRPSPLLYGVQYALGKQSMRFGYGSGSDAPASGPPAPRTWLMHPETWARLEREHPDLAATCSVNRRSTSSSFSPASST